MGESRLELLLGNEAATAALGTALARGHRQGGAGSAVLYLHGELGAGKTTCARSLLRALGVAGLIKSPSYTLVETYAPAGKVCVHVDLYRLASPGDVDDLGLRDYFARDCLLLVEWPERGGFALPPADLELTLTYAADSRRANLVARTPRGNGWLSQLSHDTSLSSYVSNLT